MKRCMKLLTVLSLVAIQVQMAQSQAIPKSKETTGFKLDFEQFDIRSLLEKTAVAPTFPAIPLERAVDPLKYVVGPSDIFSVNVWIATGLSFQSSVTPEGSLIIPTVGEVAVAGLTLADAKRHVEQRVRSKYSGGDITVTLVSPRTFIVYVTGLVAREGPYVVTATTRVDQVVALANIVPDTLAQNEMTRESFFERELKGRRKNKLDEASKRNIVVRRNDGSILRADLAKYYGTGDEASNPALVDGDMVFVPRKHITEHFIRIAGAVTLPNAYEYVDGDRLLDAIAVAQGLTPLADSSFIELVRIDANSRQRATRTLDLRKVLSGNQPNVLLERGDRVVVHQFVVLNKDYTVTIDGEVRYPGVYPITKNTTKLSDAIEMAGGFTEDAFVKGSTVIREEGNYDFSELGRGFEKFLYMRTPRWEDWDSTYFFLDQRLKKRPVNVDFARLFNDHDTASDVILYNRDHVFVPSMKRIVYVYGQVVNPGYVPWVEGMEYRFYIRTAGGFSENANEDDTRVIKGKTLEWMKPGNTMVEVGDHIYVPSKERRKFEWYVAKISQGAAIVGAIFGSVALILQINR